MLVSIETSGQVSLSCWQSFRHILANCLEDFLPFPYLKRKIQFTTVLNMMNPYVVWKLHVKVACDIARTFHNAST